MATDRVDAVVNLCKRRGFVFPSSEIYGGSRSAWDYGPLGVELKENVRRQWWQAVVRGRDDVVGLDSSVILAPQVWEASGHVATFTDPLTECKNCHKRWRADQLIEAYEEKHGRPPANGLADIACSNCGTKGDFTEPRDFNGMLRTTVGAVEDASAVHYLRPETAQGIFVNYLNVMNAARKKPPFGIGQTGKSFRNEITPGQLHLPHPRVRADGDGVLRRAGHRRGVARVLAAGALELVRRPRPEPREHALLRAPAGEAQPLLQAHRRHRVPLPLRRHRVRRARGHRQPHRLRPARRTASTPAPTCPTTTRRRRSAGSPTSSSRPPA